MCIGGEHWPHEKAPCNLLINSSTPPRLNGPSLVPHPPHRHHYRRRSQFRFRSRLLVRLEGEGAVEVEIQHLPFEMPTRVTASNPRGCRRRYFFRDQQANSTATTPLLRTPPAFLNQVVNHLPLEDHFEGLSPCRVGAFPVNEPEPEPEPELEPELEPEVFHFIFEIFEIYISSFSSFLFSVE